MQTVTQSSFERLTKHGYKTIHLFRNYYLVRNHSVNYKPGRPSLYLPIRIKNNTKGNDSNAYHN